MVQFVLQKIRFWGLHGKILGRKFGVTTISKIKYDFPPV